MQNYQYVGCIESEYIIKIGSFVTNNDIVTCNKKLLATNLVESAVFVLDKAYCNVSMLNK